MRRFSLAFVLWALLTPAFAQDLLLVVQEPVSLRVGPAAHMPAMETLPAGARLLGVERSGGWYRVRADHAVEGWVPVLSTRFAPVSGVERAKLSGLHMKQILTVRPRLEEAMELAPSEPSRYELQQFAKSARLISGRPR